MNQMNKKSTHGLREIAICVAFSFLSSIALFFALAYVFFKIPNFDDYYGVFPYTLLILEGLIIVLFCRRYSARSVYFTIVSTASISLLSLLAGLICFGFFQNLPKTLAMHFIFVIASCALQIVIQRKRPSKRRKMPFKK